ncbi:MAG TPA: PBP1A family penicillin-binding protein [Pyrinomonadaceae bacterium]|nr:PBP1A family penicillin-binding protein [Pyrinomonadaceae bacterium]
MAAEITVARTPYGVPRRKVLRFSGPTVSKARSTLRLFATIVAFSLLVALTVTTGIVISSYNTFAALIDQQIAGGYLKSHAGLYAAPRVIEKGARLNKEQLLATLQRAGYAQNQASNIWNGSFKVNDNEVRIQPRQTAASHEWISVKFDNQGYISALNANEGGALNSYSLEPELLTADASVKIGRPQNLTFEELPPVLVNAILSIEDRRFFAHNGLDVWGIGRSLLNISSRGKLHFRQGGSTITQQLAKNVYLTPEKTLRRKFDEALIAVALENRLSKQDIFALYCNEVYLGQRSGVGVRGVAQAARVFFGKELKDLSLTEAATIAGMLQSPARYAPDRHPDAARERRDQVLASMVRNGVIDSEEGCAAQTLPVSVAEFSSDGNQLAPYYLDAVNRILESSGSETVSEQILRVQTTIDPDLQSAAEQALLKQLDALGKRDRRGASPPQGALVALDPRTGHVLAMVGGRNYAESQLNRATDAQRQPGSVFKPFVYSAALESGISPLSTYSDTPQTFQYGNATYSPGNFGKSYSMHDVLMREGLIRSLNVVTVELAMQTGLDRVANSAVRFGLRRPLSYPAMALGTTEVTPLQVAAAYAAFVNDGKIVQPTLVAGVSEDGQDLTNAQDLTNLAPPATQVIRPTTAYMITDMLADVMRRGTASRAKAAFKNVAIAGKTGTSRDGWFVGYTPNLVCAVWIGYDDNKQLGLTGADAALPAWIAFMKEALALRPSLGGATFSKPAGIVTVRIDPETGFLAGPSCPSNEMVSVASQFAPVAECYKHRPEFTDIPAEESAAELIPNEAEIDAALQELDTGSETIESAADEPETISTSTAVTPSDRSTSRELNKRNRPVLVNDVRVRPEKKVVIKADEE